jgi:L-alanine-DL-glutamate epimerase-like enolase superfamily enzyme
MHITRIETHLLSAPLAHVYWMSIFPYRTVDEIVVRVHTDTGIVGIGQAHRAPLQRVKQIIEQGLAPLLVGQDPREVERLWEAMFRTTYTRSAQQQLAGFRDRYMTMTAISALDIALWDIVGKAAHQPLHRLFGGYSSELPAYASGGYYLEGQGPDVLVEEVRGYLELGYDAVKIKVGGPSLEEDVARVRAVREAIGPNVDLMLDANQGWTPPQAVRASHALERFDPYWLEEPVHWYDHIRGTAMVRKRTSIPIASGESEYTRWACREFLELEGVDILQYDATVGGGLSEWRRVAAMAQHYHVPMAPHHDPQIHMHVVAAIPNGLTLEAFPNAKRDPLWADLVDDKPLIEKGRLHLPDRPGLGYTLSEAALQRYATRLG